MPDPTRHQRDDDPVEQLDREGSPIRPGGDVPDGDHAARNLADPPPETREEQARDQFLIDEHVDAERRDRRADDE